MSYPWTRGTRLTADDLNEAVAAGIAAQAQANIYYLWYATTAALAAGSTNYIGPAGASASESGGQWVAPFAATITEVLVYANTAPVGSETHAATLRVQGADTAAAVTITGAANAGTWSGSVAVSAGQSVSLRSVLSAGAVAARFRGYIKLVRAS